MDVLVYRLPKETQVFRFKGNFEKIATGEKPLGFVVSDFLHDNLFQFNSSGKLGQNEKPQLHFSKQSPVVISHRDYQIEAQAFLNSFPLLGVEKGVYSRVKQHPFDANLAFNLFEKLAEEYPTTFCYLISSEKFGTWIGASPETLMNQKGMVLQTTALAGTHASDTESIWSKKEQEEHEFVVSAIETSLKNNACVEVEKDGPYVHIAGPVQHLKTDFKALLTQANAWEIALDLHPTPAVCGTPRNQALDAILMREMHERSLYTGFIGNFEEGNTQLFVNLRCAQIFEEKAFLYVGGGYTIDSIPELEWEETEHKAQTLLKIMKTVLKTKGH